MQTTDLAALPVDSVVRARDGRVWEKWGRDTWQPSRRVRRASARPPNLC